MKAKQKNEAEEEGAAAADDKRAASATKPTTTTGTKPTYVLVSEQGWNSFTESNTVAGVLREGEGGEGCGGEAMVLLGAL